MKTKDMATTRPASTSELSIFSNAESFELAQRAAKMLAASDLVPQQFRNNIPNCVIALNMANRLGADPFAVLQSLYIVHGRPSWSAQFMIAMVNRSGRFSPLIYKMSGEPGKDDRSCKAVAKHLETGEPVEGPIVSIDIAKKEGWFQKNGSKWQNMSELMLQYRAGSWFARLYCPDLCMGMRTYEEETDIGPLSAAPSSKALFEPAPAPDQEEVIDITEPPQEEPQEEEPKKDPRMEALAVVLHLITESKAQQDAIESILKKRGLISGGGSVARLGVEKLERIATDWESIEDEALVLSAPEAKEPSTELL